MISKTFPLFVFSLLAAIFLVSFASATVDFVAVSGATQEVSHNSQATISFNVQATSFSGQFNNASLTLPSLFGSSTSWTGDTGIFTLYPNSNVSKTVTVAVPDHQAPGTYSGTIGLSGTYNMSSPPVIHTLPVAITISSAPAISISNVQSMTKTQNATISITNTGNTNLGNVILSASGDFNVSFSSNSFSLSAGSSRTVNVNALENLADVEIGWHSVQLTAADSASGVASSITYTIAGEFCKNGNTNTSKVRITDIDDTSSDTAWEWKPLDEVTVEMDIENRLDRDEDFVVEIALYDTEKGKFVELDDEDSLEQDVSIDEDDSETVEFEFQVPSDVESSEGRYVLVVKAYVDGKESTYCNSYLAQDVPESEVDPIVIDKNSHDVYLDEITLSSDVVRAGETVTVSARAYNIGDNDESKVKIRLTNTKLGLELESSTFDLDMGDSNLIDFSFVVPYTADNGAYNLRMVSYFYYKKSSDSYSKTSNPFDIKMTVVGGAADTASKTSAGITASLESDAKAGEDMEVKVTIKNLGLNKSTFVIGATGYDDWAALSSISDRILTLDAGESKEVTVTLSVNKGVSGEQTFTIEARSGDKIDTKEVAVEITSGSFFSSLSDSLGGKTLIWIIGIVNVVLIVLIIYLAVKIFSR